MKEKLKELSEAYIAADEGMQSLTNDSIAPCFCLKCNSLDIWKNQTHTYRPEGFDEDGCVEPVTLCKKCGNEYLLTNLVDINNIINELC